MTTKADQSLIYSKDTVDSKINAVVDAVAYDGFFDGYQQVRGNNTTVLSIDINCPANGYVIVTASAIVTNVSLDVPGTPMALYGSITLDKTVLDGPYDIVGAADAWVPFNQTKGFQVSSNGFFTDIRWYI